MHGCGGDKQTQTLISGLIWELRFKIEPELY